MDHDTRGTLVVLLSMAYPFATGTEAAAVGVFIYTMLAIMVCPDSILDHRSFRISCSLRDTTPVNHPLRWPAVTVIVCSRISGKCGTVSAGRYLLTDALNIR